MNMTEKHLVPKYGHQRTETDGIKSMENFLYLVCSAHIMMRKQKKSGSAVEIGHKMLILDVEEYIEALEDKETL